MAIARALAMAPKVMLFDEVTAALDPETKKEVLVTHSVQEAADMLGINYFTMYRLIQRQKLKTCRVLRGKLLVPRTELLQLLQTDLR